mgnify:CR=1 FL=1
MKDLAPAAVATIPPNSKRAILIFLPALFYVFPGLPSWIPQLFPTFYFLAPGDRFVIRQYSPVVTIGGLLAGVPVKSMLAVTAISEGTVSTISLITWLVMLTSGVTIDYLLLPSFMLATMFSAVAAPYMTRVFPEKLWKIVVPAYCLCLTAYAFWKVIPDILTRLAG